MTDSHAQSAAFPQPVVPAELGAEIFGPGRRYFADPVIDHLLDALLELSAAVWTYHDRVTVLEKVLESHGMNVGAEIEAHVPDAAEQAARAAERAALVERVFGGFVRQPVDGGAASAGEK